jgi:hypothetical protein
MARANVNLTGFRYWGSVFGENIIPRETPVQVASAYATALFAGDPIKLASDGTAQQAAAGDPIFGIVTSARYLNAAGAYVESTYLPASISYTPDAQRSIVMVIPATAFTIFEVDADDGSTITTLANARALRYENCDHVFTSSGNTGTGVSGCELDISTHSTSSFGWRIWDLSPAAPNDFTQTKAKYLVICNETQNWPGTFSTTGI